MKKYITKLVNITISTICILGASLALASSGNYPLEKAPKKVSDVAALQRGAKLFVNYCLNCHSASAMRYNRLKDIGLTDEQIKQNLLFTSEKIGDTMQIAMNYKDAKKWFGATPPDLSVIARSNGKDWLYTYMRSFYVDESRTTGWNNALFPNVGMPHVLWELQGLRSAKYVEETDPHDHTKKISKIAGFEQITPGLLNAHEYDEATADLVAFLDWMSEPAQNNRKRMGLWILLYLALFTILAWRLNANYWKDIK